MKQTNKKSKMKKFKFIQGITGDVERKMNALIDQGYAINVVSMQVAPNGIVIVLLQTDEIIPEKNDA